MGVVLVAQGVLKPPLHFVLDVPVVALLMVPALIDWTVGRFRPAAGSNTVRFLTGCVLGLGLARALYVHLHEPFPPVLVYPLLLVTLVATPVILATYRSMERR
jgi:hypothetical protein